MENNYQEKLKQQLYDGIQIKATLVGKSQMTSGNEYKIRLEHNGKFALLPYHTNINDIVDKQDIVECLLLDSEAYEIVRPKRYPIHINNSVHVEIAVVKNSSVNHIFVHFII